MVVVVLVIVVPGCGGWLVDRDSVRSRVSNTTVASGFGVAVLALIRPV